MKPAEQLPQTPPDEPVNRAVAPKPGQGLHVLVVDDEPVMCNLLARSMQQLGYTVTTAASGEEAVELFAKHKFDLVMLDVLMPGMDGFEVCSRLRRTSDVPICMLTSLNRPDDIIRGLDLGADNYITKPFNFKELEARVRAVLRRTAHMSGFAEFEVAAVGDIILYNASHEISLAGRRMELTPTEFALLRYLASQADRPVGKEELLQEVWGYADAENSNLVELAIRRLRTKIEEDPSRPKRLVTMRGIGYRLNSMPAAT